MRPPHSARTFSMASFHHPSFPGAPPPHYIDMMGNVITNMGIDATSRQHLQQNLGRVTAVASSTQLQREFKTICLGVDAEHRARVIRTLSGPRGYEAGQHIQCFVLIECNQWLIDSPDAYNILCLVAERARNLKLVHIGFNDRYLNWALLPRRVHLMFIRVMRQANTVILEGVKNVPLALIYALEHIRCLDLAQIKLAPMTPQDAIAPNTIPRAAPRALSVHTRFEDDWNDNESDGTLRTVRTLKDYPGIRFNRLRTLYLDFLGCNGCAKTWKEAIGLCKNTLESLRLNYYPEGDGEWAF